MRRFLPFLFALLLLALPVHAQSSGTPTTVVVRAVANDAKLLQDPVGGAQIIIRDANTGAVLAEGIQTGDSGSTDKIMRQPHERGATIYEAPGAAKFETTLTLNRPVPVEITAEGPLDYPHALQRARTSVLLVPGKDITGDGIILTLNGFIVELLAPSDLDVSPGETMTVRSRVRLLCGCPTEPGGLWDASRYDLRAQFVNDEGQIVSETDLAFAGTTSEYTGDLLVPQDATTLRVLATDAERVNFGMVEKSLD
jgi:hypothetical protein